MRAVRATINSLSLDAQYTLSDRSRVRRAITFALLAGFPQLVFASSIRDQLQRPLQGCDAISAHAERLIAENYADANAIVSECDILCKESDPVRQCKVRGTPSSNRRRRQQAVTGISMGVALGASLWVPTQNLAILGNHPGLPIDMYIGYNRWTFALLMDIRFGGTPQNYLYFNENTQSLRSTNQFLGLLIGLDVRYKFVEMDHLTFALIGGVGYDFISHYAVARYSRLTPAYSESLNLNGGVAVRFFPGEEKNIYLELQGRIHRANFGTAGNGGTDLTGHYYSCYLLAGYHIAF